MDITAFEYNRKFSKELNLGECPSRDVSIPRPDRRNTVEFATQPCSLRKRGTVTSVPRELNDTRNVPILTPNDVVAYLGLCGGEAASFLGILHKGDCVAIEIASLLTFNDKTMVRAYVEYYRKKMDILNSSLSPRNEYEHYYDGRYYLKNRSYGTLEIIIVQFRFKSKKMTIEAKKVETDISPLMSVYMEEVRLRAGMPTSLVVIRLSTAGDKYDKKKFRKGGYQQALRYVQVLETEIRHVRERIIDNEISPHLNYALFPFKEEQPQYRMGASLLTWEKTSMLEVSIRQGINIGKKAARKCRHSKANKLELCVRVKALLKKLKVTQREIHKIRSNWMTLTLEEKNKFSDVHGTRVNSYINVMKRLARDVRKWRKQMKKQKQKDRKNQAKEREIKKMSSDQPWFLRAG
ncbi:hypothetical protein LOTGIDRAFT_235406 [Lottia gigantea]|uniref:Uncharacterized protein n=1 Tax=Lottia gigantea TaxID=225164 RepID=V3Z6G0_LOTGI|nr:hypothetical protein LOTGIDRAFT_235406 [Lottia gigantea]ESO86343.1 hypothetical protein LOTGIDRAFT_235406 [Lottia gigantea]